MFSLCELRALVRRGEGVTGHLKGGNHDSIPTEDAAGLSDGVSGGQLGLPGADWRRLGKFLWPGTIPEVTIYEELVPDKFIIVMLDTFVVKVLWCDVIPSFLSAGG